MKDAAFTQHKVGDTS